MKLRNKVIMKLRPKRQLKLTPNPRISPQPLPLPRNRSLIRTHFRFQNKQHRKKTAPGNMKNNNESNNRLKLRMKQQLNKLKALNTIS